MKGIAHFAAGTALASCFPAAVEAGAAGNPLYFVLGGCFGLLPDTLDFRFVRFLFRHDMEIAPDPARPDPRMVAEALALAMRRAAATGRRVRVKLNTVRTGADTWQPYEAHFDTARERIAVRWGAPVDTGGNPVDGRADAAAGPAATAAMPCAARVDYLARTAVDIFDGPVVEFRPEGPGTVRIVFLPWHRQWSHSFVIGLLLSLAAGAAWGPLAAAVAFAGYAAHIALDQAGFMGSNLLFPFTRDRVPGWRLTHSGRALPNFTTVWTGALLIYWNLARAAPQAGPPPGLVPLALLGLALPAGLHRLFRRRASCFGVIPGEAPGA